MRILIICVLLTVIATEFSEAILVPLQYHPLSRAKRVKRQWSSMYSLWSGWRCSGVNGLFLDCAGKK
uniref:Secreted protein n=1 Tax=Steinernema glaseri TaxID=37863 RepID=A0A1I7ZG17_9BILA